LIYRTPFIAAFIITGDIIPKGKEDSMTFAIYHPLLSLIAGILILIMPRLLNYVIAIYLIITGIVGLMR